MFDLFVYADSVDTFFYKLNAKILNPVIEFAFILAFVVFMFGLMEFLRGANNEKKRSEGKQHMLWGVIGFVVMFGVFGIVTLIANTFGIGGVSVGKKEQKIELPGNLQEINIPR